jgi:hypothetical protein
VSWLLHFLRDAWGFADEIIDELPRRWWAYRTVRQRHSRGPFDGT